VNERRRTNKMVKQRATIQLELVTNGQASGQEQSETTITNIDDQEGLDCCVAASSAGDRSQWPRPRSKGIRRAGTNEKRQIKVKNNSSFKSILIRLLWSSSRAFNLCLLINLWTVAIISLASVKIPIFKCDDDVQQAQRTNQYDYDQKHRNEYYDLIQSERDGRQLNLDTDYIGQHQASMATLSNNINVMSNVPPMYSQTDDRQRTAASLLALRPTTNDQGNGDLNEQEQLETSQTKAQTNAVSSSATNPDGVGDKSSDSSGGVSTATAQTPSISASSSSTNTLSEHLNAVNKLIQQAGQLGLSAAQQNVALSEAIINSVTNSLSGGSANRRPTVVPAQSAPPSASSSSATANRPAANLVGQSIDGNINYDPNSNTINGFIDFPNFPNLSNLTGSLPSLGGAVKPLVLAAIKTAPIKIGSVGWKLLKLLAWKKIYKAHHPKSGEIIIEQEVKHGGSHVSDKGVKEKIGEHFENKFKSPKMGQSYMGDDHWMSMMRSAGRGHGGDLFSAGGWPSGDSAASASMIYQRHLLPVSLPHSSGASQQQATAVAAAAAATAAAIQSHWAHQQHQQQMIAEESGDSQSAKANQTNSGANALRRKKASFGGGNWFAAAPAAHAYAAAAAAANAAAAMASQQQQQQQQQQRLTYLMRGYDSHAHHPDEMAPGPGPNNPGGSIHHALATGLMYQSLFDNAAAMAVQNAVKLPPTHHHSHSSSDDFMDQSDSLSGSSFGSLSNNVPNDVGSITDAGLPMALMQRRDITHHLDSTAAANHPMFDQPAFDNHLATVDYLPRDSGVHPFLHRSNSFLDGMADFDDTPAGKILDKNLFHESPQHRNYKFGNG
jgi:hypothetical protein